MFYSKSTKGFYSTEIHGENIPQDAVEITAEEHQALLAGQSQGKLIVPDDSGRPTLQDHQPSEAELKERCRAIARGRLQDTDYSQLADVNVHLTNKAEFDAYRAAVRALFFSPVTDPVWPDAPVAAWAPA